MTGAGNRRAGTASTERVRLRSVALPTEHGGWSLTAEPAALGLLVAWSGPGLALAVGAMVAFVARTPLKVVLVDRWRHRWLDRTKLAAGIAAAEIVVLVALAGYAVAAGRSFWLPLALAAPLILLELWFDMRSRSRRLIPELAGSIGIGAVATAIALADGTDDRIAWGLWAVVAVRSVAAIPFVRTQILRSRSTPGPRWPSDVAQVAATVGALLGWGFDLVPGATVVVIAVVAAANLVAVRRPVERVVVIGIQQMIVGVVVIVATTIALR